MMHVVVDDNINTGVKAKHDYKKCYDINQYAFQQGFE